MPGKQKILITGSSGMLGVDLCKELGGDYELYGMDKVHSPWSIVHSFEKSDITDAGEVEKTVKKIIPEVIIHTAAMTDVDGCEQDKDRAYRINVLGTENVALACEKAGAIMIHISTDFIFDGKKKEPYREDDRPLPLNVYGDSKLKAEESVKKNLKKYFILRTSWLYGKNGRNFVDTILTKSKIEEELRVVCDQVGSPTYTVDLARAIRVLLNKTFTVYRLPFTGWGIYHVSNAGRVSWCEYAREILMLAGSKTKVSPISSKILNRPAVRPAMSVLDNAKFTNFTGYKMRDWKDALKEYIKE